MPVTPIYMYTPFKQCNSEMKFILDKFSISFRVNQVPFVDTKAFKIHCVILNKITYMKKFLNLRQQKSRRQNLHMQN